MLLPQEGRIRLLGSERHEKGAVEEVEVAHIPKTRDPKRGGQLEKLRSPGTRFHWQTAPGDLANWAEEQICSSREELRMIYSPWN